MKKKPESQKTGKPESQKKTVYITQHVFGRLSGFPVARLSEFGGNKNVI